MSITGDQPLRTTEKWNAERLRKLEESIRDKEANLKAERARLEALKFMYEHGQLGS